MRRGFRAAPAAVLALLVAGCSSSGRGSDPDPAGTPPPTSVQHTGAPPTLHNAVGARADLDSLRCEHDVTGSWSATGTLHNASSKTADFAVSVYVVRSGTGSVVGQISKVWRLKQDASVKVAFDDFYANRNVKGLTCVPHVVRGDA